MKKKATKKDIENVLSSMIQDMASLRRAIYGIDIAMTEYIRYKGDESDFIKHMESIKEKQVESEGSK